MVFQLIFLTLAEPKYNTNTKPRLPFLKPKTSTGSAFSPVISNSRSYEKRASICSQEVNRTMNEFKCSLNDSIAARLLKSANKDRPQSPVPDDEGEDFTSAKTPHEVRSLLPQKSLTRSISPNQLVIFPPEFPSEYRARSKTSTPESHNKPIIMIEPPVFKTTNKTNSQSKNTIFEHPDECSKYTELKYIPKFHGVKGPISMAMEIAPDRPFTPVAVTEPIIKPAPWIPLPVENENRPESPLVAALKTAPERSYSPLPTFMYASELVSLPTENPSNKFKETISINQTPTASRSFNLKSSEPNTSARLIGNNPVKYIHGYNNKIPVAQLQNNKTFQPISTIKTQKEQLMFDLEPKSPSDKLSISGPYEPVESKSNYNETFITRVPNFKESNKLQPNYVFSTLNQNISESPQKTLKPQAFMMSDEKSNSCRSLGPGIKNKVFTFTPNPSVNDTQVLRQSSNNSYCKVNTSIDEKSSSLENRSITHKGNHPNSIKLSKAVPFFSNGKSSFSS